MEAVGQLIGFSSILHLQNLGLDSFKTLLEESTFCGILGVKQLCTTTKVECFKLLLRIKEGNSYSIPTIWSSFEMKMERFILLLKWLVMKLLATLKKDL